MSNLNTDLRKVKGKKMGRFGVLVSNLDHPVNISYNGEGMMLAPRGRKPKIDSYLLGAYPRGVSFVPNKI